MRMRLFCLFSLGSRAQRLERGGPCYFNEHASHRGTGEHKCTFNNVAHVAPKKSD